MEKNGTVEDLLCEAAKEVTCTVVFYPYIVLAIDSILAIAFYTNTRTFTHCTHTHTHTFQIVFSEGSTQDLR